MFCANCNKQAFYVCKFCGAMICKLCRRVKPYFMAVYDEQGDVPQVLVVEDSSWCGNCHPVQSPIRMPELE